jgi:hypothetical protein
MMGRCTCFAWTLLALLGCGGATPRSGPEPVPLGTWCEEASAMLCEAIADECFGGAGGFAEGCTESSLPGCLAGRDASSASGRTYDDLAACHASLRPMSCEELGYATGTGLAGSGPIADHCAARPPP